jgi:multiple sugar transport system substrate-binding protein
MRFHRVCRRISRQSFWLALVSFVVLAGCAGTETGPSGSPSSINWRQFQGTTLRVLLTNTPWQGAIVKYLPEFMELTGIQVRVDVLSQDQLWKTLETDLKTPGRVDVFAVIPNLDGLHYANAGYTQPVNDYLRNPRLTATNYVWDDFFPKFREAMQVRGAILGPPVMAENMALLYRKDVFSRYQVAVPRTLDELEAAARFLHKKAMSPQGATGVGLVSRGHGPTATGLYASLLHSFGGTWLDGRGRPTLDGPQSLEALQWMNRVLGQYAPPDLARFGWQEASALFLEGRSAMYIEGSSIYPLIEESNSRIAEKVGYAQFPSGPAGFGATVAVRGLAIAKQSAAPEAAWLFMQWASGPEMVRKALMHGVLVARESTWKDRVARSEVPPDLAETLQQAGRTGRVDWLPPLVAVTSAREVVGRVITAALQGGNIREAADRANRDLEDIIAKTERAPGTAPR